MLSSALAEVPIDGGDRTYSVVHRSADVVDSPIGAVHVSPDFGYMPAHSYRRYRPTDVGYGCMPAKTGHKPDSERSVACNSRGSAFFFQ